MLGLYSHLMRSGTPFLRAMLRKRSRRGKEDPARLGERMGEPGLPRPDGPLLWLHAASVGEAQSALIMLDALLARYPSLHVLVTTGTVNSAALMKKRLPARALHQFIPVDHPAWVESFINHWRPDMALWMESELWPNMLGALRARDIPAALVNARLSPLSVKRWRKAKNTAHKILSTFAVIMAQTEPDAQSFRDLGAANVLVMENLKYAAAPLPVDEKVLAEVKKAVGNRPVWVYASTHAGEEELACRLHRHLQRTLPDLLTIIVPRHPERRAEIEAVCKRFDIPAILRSHGQALPAAKDQIYIADTMGELGLFYRLAPLACIGRSFSDDGGGGHNPIEAAQLDCAVLHGPRIQNFEQLYGEMNEAGAAMRLKDERDFQTRLDRLLSDEDGLAAQQRRAVDFVAQRAKVLDDIMAALEPLLQRAMPGDDVGAQRKQAQS